MTVSELIEALKKFPPDALVVYNDGDYKDSYSFVSTVEAGKGYDAPTGSAKLS